MSRWVKAAKKSGIPVSGLAVDVGGESVLLIRKGEDVFALSNTCSHQEMELCGGEIEGDAWICPHHGARFGLKDGKTRSMPAVDDIKAYKTRCEGEDVFVEEE